MKTFITSAVSMLLLLVLVLAVPPPDVAKQETTVENLLFHEVENPVPANGFICPYTAPKFTAAYEHSSSEYAEVVGDFSQGCLPGKLNFYTRTDTPKTTNPGNAATLIKAALQYGENFTKSRRTLACNIDKHLRYVFRNMRF